MVDEKVLNMMASRTTPTMGQGDQGGEHPGRLLRMFGKQLLGELGHEGGPAADPGLTVLGGAAQPVVLHHEAVQALERIVLRRDPLPQVLGGGPDRLFEQGQEELVLAPEVLVEAAERLTRTIDHLLDREVLARARIEELDGGVEEALHPGFGTQPGGVEGAGHR
jgi:hypothetical protein